ncbi:ATP-binding cassette domain-containing protein [Corynebacterium sp. 3HC-13]|uniref:ABC transporter ATP-binding protein n=1 Tax=Corynebacterium poyangense TaxID=2684405 RepID=UPI001CCF1865|nr:ABC transporter ATP-binding protein [Corynebacterium poyangense]MBZ8177401.1 ATP-binding cassette domain-containing protein [Corynebacterium poyangense]
MTPQIRARGYGWRHAGRAKPALANIDLEIERGERILILGTSGAGKSTLLGAIAGVLGSSEDGEAAGKLEVRGRVGLVLQDPDSQAVSAQVGDDIAFGLENLSVPPDEMWPRVRRALELVGLDLPLHHLTKELSGGQRQRLALAGVLAMQPGIIALDEPTANIDPDSVPDLVAATAQAVAETHATLLVVEHRVAEWLPLIERVIVLGDAGIIVDGPRDVVLAEHGDELREHGIWIPGPAPVLPQAQAIPEHPDTLIEGVELSLGWPGSPAVRSDMNVALPVGHGVCITGKNGSGKSTLALTLGGLLPPQAGHVIAHPRLRGSLSEPSPYRWRSRELCQRIGSVFQNPEHQFLCRTVREELAFGETPKTRVDELLTRLRLEHLAEANPFTLSGGEKRRLSVATALTHAPQLLILDEPTFGQDRRTFSEVVHLLDELCREGTTVCTVTHDPLVVQALGEQEIRL